MLILLTALLPHAVAETVPAPTTLEGLLAGLKATYAQTEAIQADFTQVTRSDLYGEGPVQTGQIILGRPRMMRITFQGDAGSLFLSDGDSLYVYSTLSNQVIITPDLAERSDGVTDLLSSLSALEERFEIALLRADDAAIDLSLTPRDAGQVNVEVRLRPVGTVEHITVDLRIGDAGRAGGV